LAVHVPVDDGRNVGAPAGAAKGCALPDTAGDELEWPRGDLLARLRHPDDDAFAPAAMAGLQGLAHHCGVAGAVEVVVRAAVGQLDEMRHQIAFDVLWIDEICHAETPAPRFTVRID